MLCGLWEGHAHLPREDLRERVHVPCPPPLVECWQPLPSPLTLPVPPPLFLSIFSWGSDDLRIKYRHETSREEAWAASQAAEAAAEKLRLTEGVIVPYALVERHPLYIAYFDLVRSEFRKAIDRARQRNRMKRFVSDVHTLWLTNLAALREHSMQVCSISLSVLDVVPKCIRLST